MSNQRRTIKEMPHTVRPRERLQSFGSRSLSDAEVLALLLGTGSSRTGESALDLAHQLLIRWKGQGLSRLADLSTEELCGLEGIGLAKACTLLAAVELGHRIGMQREQRTIISGPEDAAGMLMEDMKHLDREHFKVLLLNTKNQVVALELISVGSLDSSIVHPREIFKVCIRRSAAAVILAHNHPSGDPTPSPNDLEVTRRLISAGHVIGIRVLDHLIIGDRRYCSLRQEGMDWDVEDVP